MNSSRRERLYLADIVDATDAIATFVAGIEEARFIQDDLVRSAVLHKRQVIGEAAAHIGETTREGHPDIP